MSGGSWEYAYQRIEEVANRLCRSSQPNRRALGQRVALIAKAMHDIEWVDSCDCSPGDEDKAIAAALGASARHDILRASVQNAERVLAELRAVIEAAKEPTDGK